MCSPKTCSGQLFFGAYALARTKAQSAFWQVKEDMIAYKELRQRLTPEQVIGHIPGVAPGEAFRGKGELAITGIHCNINAGIYFKCGMKYPHFYELQSLCILMFHNAAWVRTRGPPMFLPQVVEGTSWA